MNIDKEEDMKITHRLTAVFLGVVVMLSATVTHAQLPPGPHFTFTVPLHLANLAPEIGIYSVICTANTARGTLGLGHTSGNISGGRVDTDVVVNVTVTTRTDPSAHPANATAFKCHVVLESAAGVVPFLQYLPDNHVVRFPLASGAGFVPWVRGTLPH